MYLLCLDTSFNLQIIVQTSPGVETHVMVKGGPGFEKHKRCVIFFSIVGLRPENSSHDRLSPVTFCVNQLLQQQQKYKESVKEELYLEIAPLLL